MYYILNTRPENEHSEEGDTLGQNEGNSSVVIITSLTNLLHYFKGPNTECIKKSQQNCVVIHINGCAFTSTLCKHNSQKMLDDYLLGFSESAQTVIFTRPRQAVGCSSFNDG